MDQLEAAQTLRASRPGRRASLLDVRLQSIVSTTIPTLKAWQTAFSDKGVTIIGVHTPETDRERQIENVRKSVTKNGLKYPIVFDKDAKIWKSWGNQWWPSTYLIDKQGFVRYRWDGEFNWKKAKGDSIMRKKIEQLLAENNPAAGGQ